MKKKFVYFAMSLSMVMTVFAVPIAIHAENGNSTTPSGKPTTNPSSSTTPPTPTPDTTTQPSVDDQKSRDSRVEEYKKELKETVTNDEKTHITSRCSDAQKTVQGKATDNATATNEHQKTYTDILNKLQVVADAASAKGVDASALLSERNVLITKVEDFINTNATFRQAITDLTALNCKTDPVGFKAALTVARTDQVAVQAAAKDIRTYLTDTVKPTLKTIKTALESTSN